MPPSLPRNQKSHAEIHKKSYALLSEARETRSEKLKMFNLPPDDLRTKIKEEMNKILPHIAPHEWQLDDGEAVSLGLDTILVAGSGAGKTLPFVMPLLANKGPRKKILIISPLNVLQEDQHDLCNKMGIPAVAVNSETYNIRKTGKGA
ncbi:hypothetical protein M422DRAFT_268388 [Sphaerobolus stellatus SS14]|uniref:DEAD/DEAH-box helicase domain-containing protein n=1 Tax=Sphaerobolus stellatus (strain SS14) TaxID=990650 RepID=A0A0C9UMT7_SPHS4|nr:hypothetical protein M422DRAFT_268388 [Sphaerobolus stellatus SS14]